MIEGTRTAMGLGFATAAVLIGGFGSWAVFARLDGAVIAPGFIQVQENRQVVQHPDGGVVEEIFVKDGDFVEAGALLLRLDEFEIRSELVIVGGQLFELMARRGRLEAERDDRADVTFPPELLTEAATRSEISPLMAGQVSLFEARRETLNQEINQISERQAQVASQVEGIDVQLTALTTQQSLIAHELDLQQQLLKQGLTQLSKVLSLQREQARLEGQVGELKAQRAQAESRRVEYALESLRLTKTRREDAITELRQFGSQELELVERRRALVQRLSRLDIRAPVSGVVLDLAITARRAVLKPADPVLYLVPQDRPLRVVAQVANADVDNVRSGQDVQLVFSAFPSRTTPQLPGHVLTVSADALQDQQSGQHFYKVEIAPDFDQGGALDDLQLVPGMPVETFIRTGERSPLSYLLQPLTVYFSKALRET